MKMKRVRNYGYTVFILFLWLPKISFAAGNDTISPLHKVTLREAHIGDLAADTKLLDSYGLLPNNIRAFYLQSRAYFSENPDADFSDSRIMEIARKCNLPLMGGPMLGRLNEQGVVVWLRPSTADPLVVRVTKTDGRNVYSAIQQVNA